MLNIIACIAILSLTLGGLPGQAQASPVADFRLQPATQAVRVGQIFSVAIWVNASTQAVDTIGAFVDFNPTYIKVVDASDNVIVGASDNVIQPGPITNTNLTVKLGNRVDNTKGYADLRYGIPPVGGVAANTDFLFGTIRFKALAATTSTNVTFHTVLPRETVAVLGGDPFTGTLTPATVTIQPALLNSITVTPTNPSVPKSRTQQFTTSLLVDTTGKAQSTVQLKTTDEKASLTINIGTKLLDARGFPLRSFSASVVTTPPAPARTAYDFGPDGATFDPAITLAMTYETLPSGAKESDLYIAYWDGSQWQALASTVDTATKTVSAPVSHFTQFAVLSKLPAPLPPAKFTISDFSVTPKEVKPDELVTVKCGMTNTGGSTGKYTVVLKINNVEVNSKEVTLGAGKSETVTFMAKRAEAGRYAIALDGNASEFTVMAPVVPTPTPIPKPVPTPTPTPVAPPPPGPNWGLIGGIIAGVIILGVIGWLVWRR